MRIPWADLILLHKDLQVLERGILEGGRVFGNIVKYVKMAASSNFGNALSVLLASAFLPFLPMLSLQLLVQNLLYDLSQMALPWDHLDGEFLARPRQWEARSIARVMPWLGPISSLFDLTTFGLLWCVFQATNPAGQSLFQSGWYRRAALAGLDRPCVAHPEDPVPAEQGVVAGAFPHWQYHAGWPSPPVYVCWSGHWLTGASLKLLSLAAGPVCQNPLPTSGPLVAVKGRCMLLSESALLAGQRHSLVLPIGHARPHGIVPGIAGI